MYFENSGVFEKLRIDKVNRFSMTELLQSSIMAADQKQFDLTARCPIPDVCIDERRLPLFIARATLRDLIAGQKAQ